MDLIMPDKLKNITIKIIGPVKFSGKGDNIRFYCDCRIFGDVKKNIFKLHITKSLMRSLYDELKMREEIGDDSYKIDNSLECLIGRIITIRGIPDINRAYTMKDGGLDSPKIFNVIIREDLEEAERVGGGLYIKSVEKENRICKLCIDKNMRLVDDQEIKRLEREIKMEKRKEEIINKDIKGIDNYFS